MRSKHVTYGIKLLMLLPFKTQLINLVFPVAFSGIYCVFRLKMKKVSNVCRSQKIRISVKAGQYNNTSIFLCWSHFRSDRSGTVMQ